MSSIPAGQWLNPEGNMNVCGFRGCGQPSVEGVSVFWYVDARSSIVLWTCDKHRNAAAHSWERGTTAMTGTGNIEWWAV